MNNVRRFLVAIIVLTASAHPPDAQAATVAALDSFNRGEEAVRFDLVQRAKAHLVRNFKDPSSAQWRELYLMGDVLCGEVNGKNSYGAYVGFRRFYSRPPRAHPLSDTSDYADSGIDGDGVAHDLFISGVMGKCDLASGQKRIDIPDAK